MSNEEGVKYKNQMNSDVYLHNMSERYNLGRISGWFKEIFQNSYDAYFTRNLTSGLLSIEVKSNENKVIVRDNCGGMDKETVFEEYLFFESKEEKEGSGFRGQGSGLMLLLPEKGSSVWLETLRKGERVKGNFLLEKENGKFQPNAYDKTNIPNNGPDYLLQDGLRLKITDIKEKHMNELSDPEVFRKTAVRYFNEAISDPNFELDITIDGEEVEIEPENHSESTVKKPVKINKDFDGDINIKDFTVFIHGAKRNDLFKYTGHKMVRLNNEFGLTIEYYKPQNVERQSRISALVELENELENPVNGKNELKKLEKTSHEGYKEDNYEIIKELQHFVKSEVNRVSEDFFSSDKEVEMTEQDKIVAKTIEKNLKTDYVGTRDIKINEEEEDEDKEKPYVNHISVINGSQREYGEDIKCSVECVNPTDKYPEIELVTELLYPRSTGIEKPIKEKRINHHFTEEAIREEIEFEGLGESYEKGRYRIRTTLVPKTYGFKEDSSTTFIRLEVEEGQSEEGEEEKPGLKIHKNEFDREKEPEKRRQSKFSSSKEVIDINILSPSWKRAERENRLDMYKYNQVLDALKTYHMREIQEIDGLDERTNKMKEIIQNFAEAKGKIDFSGLSEEDRSDLKQKREKINL